MQVKTECEKSPLALSNVVFRSVLASPLRNGIYKAPSYHGSGAKIINMGELFANPRLGAVPMNRVELTPSETDQFGVQPGDLLFARRSLVLEGAGKCSVVMEVDGPTTFESSIIRARIDPSKANSIYLFYFWASRAGQYCLSLIRRQVAVAGITGSDLAQLVIPLPPLPEQRDIATALSDVDALINSLDRLIAKKRDIKQATMQQLLTGKTRLPGFSGAWSAKAIGPEIDLVTGFPFPSSMYSKTGVRLLRGSNVKRGSTDWSDAITQFWPSLSQDIAKFELLIGDLVIAMDGSLVGRSFALLGPLDMPCILLQRVARIRSKTLDIGYLAQVVGSEAFVKYADSVKTVTAIPHISPSDIKRFTMPVPPSLQEQRAIATILLDIDLELVTLEQRRDKTLMLKLGMMQEFLTGRTRLV